MDNQKSSILSALEVLDSIKINMNKVDEEKPHNRHISNLGDKEEVNKLKAKSELVNKENDFLNTKNFIIIDNPNETSENNNFTQNNKQSKPSAPPTNNINEELKFSKETSSKKENESQNITKNKEETISKNLTQNNFNINNKELLKEKNNSTKIISPNIISNPQKIPKNVTSTQKILNPKTKVINQTNTQTNIYNISSPKFKIQQQIKIPGKMQEINLEASKKSITNNNPKQENNSKHQQVPSPIKETNIKPKAKTGNNTTNNSNGFNTNNGNNINTISGSNLNTLNSTNTITNNTDSNYLKQSKNDESSSINEENTLGILPNKLEVSKSSSTHKQQFISKNYLNDVVNSESKNSKLPQKLKSSTNNSNYASNANISKNPLAKVPVDVVKANVTITANILNNNLKGKNDKSPILVEKDKFQKVKTDVIIHSNNNQKLNDIKLIKKVSNNEK